MLPQISRKKFILFGTAVLGFASLFKLKFFGSPTPSKNSKYLTQDGKLVEVEDQHVTSRNKIYTSEIQHWISKRTN
ncbi:MAG: hypothetical protein IPM92_02050 [Saprospiraceae bacterium]|nr:hypothetical protein [Saprospiraceae bacterium]